MLKKLAKLGWDVMLYKRYVDDILIVVRGLQPGVRYNAQKDQLELVQEEIEGDTGVPEDRRTMEILKSVANSIDKDIRLTIDCPSLNTNQKLPCLDLQLWLDSEGLVKHEFYAKPMSSPLLILRRSAVSNSVKRTTCFQEAIRRLRSCSVDLDWDLKAAHLNKFSWQMKISGYPEGYRRSVISGAVQRYQEMVKTEQEGGTPLFRSRKVILNKKESKKGRCSASWFLQGDVRQIVMLPATPGSKLVQEVRKEIGNIRGPDKGVTKVIERGGKPVTAGLIKKNPFPRDRCDFDEPRCIVGAGCSTVGACYEINCKLCEGESGDSGAPNPRRHKYIGQSGTTIHRRMLSHISKKDSVISRHQGEYHQGAKETKEMVMKVTKVTRGVLERLVSEGLQIAKADQLEPGRLMNGRGEYQKSKMVRFETSAKKI